MVGGGHVMVGGGHVTVGGAHVMVGGAHRTRNHQTRTTTHAMVMLTIQTPQEPPMPITVKYRTRDITMKGHFHGNNKVSPTLANMLCTYTTRMRDTSPEAIDFFKDLQSALVEVLLRHDITPLPKSLNIIDTSKVQTHLVPHRALVPPLMERQLGPPLLGCHFGSTASIGILWDTKPEQDKDGKAQLSHSTFLKLDLLDNQSLDYKLKWLESPQAITRVHV